RLRQPPGIRVPGAAGDPEVLFRSRLRRRFAARRAQRLLPAQYGDGILADRNPARPLPDQPPVAPGPFARDLLRRPRGLRFQARAAARCQLLDAVAEGEGLRGRDLLQDGGPGARATEEQSHTGAGGLRLAGPRFLGQRDPELYYRDIEAAQQPLPPELYVGLLRACLGVPAVRPGAAF